MNNTIYFYIPEPMVLFDINATLMMRMNEAPDHFRDNVQIGAVYGCFPGNIWNGGRVSGGFIEQRAVLHCIDAFRENQTPLRFTWTNVALEEEHYSDPICNWIMRRAQNGINEVLVNDPKLEAYIREHYPDYPIISSTTKCLKDIDAVNEELEKDYKIVVLDYSFNNNWELLDQIKHPEKCEILVNAACNPNCPMRAEHYKALSRAQINTTEDGDAEVTGCGAFNRSYYEIKQLPTFVSWDKIKNEYIPKGFRHFKIEGRNSNPLLVLEFYLYYLVKEEYLEEERSQLLNAAARQFISPYYNIR